MPQAEHVERWTDTIRSRYENYLKTSFFFKNRALRDSFERALREEGSLLKGPYEEQDRGFEHGTDAHELAREHYSGSVDELLPALRDGPLYVHQERSVRRAYGEQRNVVVATGTASGKTESFLYPILFELYRQYLDGGLGDPGVRAMVLYPMNALANDQRERLGAIVHALSDAGSAFHPTFGQYIGQTPHDRGDRWRSAAAREEERLPGELIFREEMRNAPPHILLTNYSMLEYLLIRPDDSPLFDGGRGVHWRFIVLDEAHQYRGAKGMEMGMLIRRLKQRLVAGGRKEPFQCIATSATLSSGEGEDDKKGVAGFAQELFGESLSPSDVIFGSSRVREHRSPRRYHTFLRALEGAFLVHNEGQDAVVLNRKGELPDGTECVPLEIALCRECGEHYYVGRERHGRLEEAVRDPSQSGFGVEYFRPLESSTGATHVLCRRCGAMSARRHTKPNCNCGTSAALHVARCASHRIHPDQLKECASCGYQRGGVGDPVQEIVHGSDGPNAVIATALHELLPENGRKLLAFADSRQEAAFFAWYAEESYRRLRDRNLILRALQAGAIASEGLSIDDLKSRLFTQWEHAGLFSASDTAEGKVRAVLESIFREVLTDEHRLSLSGVGLVNWTVKIPDDVALPDGAPRPPWNLSEYDTRRLLGYLLDELRLRGAVELPAEAGVPAWNEVSSWPQLSYGIGTPGKRRNVRQWGSASSAVVTHFLYRLLADSGLSDVDKRSACVRLMREMWSVLRTHDGTSAPADQLLSRGSANGTFRLNARWLRVTLTRSDEIWECDTCATIILHNIRGICPRHRCPGTLRPADHARLRRNHYRILYESASLPPKLHAEEHTAQIASDEARQRQERFKRGDIHLLSSSTTFEVGVDLGDLEAVFVRNVPPEPFNYTQRVGRAGRRETPGLAVTYCRRNPHDLYHYESPAKRILHSVMQAPRLQVTNTKIVIRHMAATALSAFFRETGNAARFTSVQEFIGDWQEPRAVSQLRHFCRGNTAVQPALRNIVPERMHEDTGLTSDGWVELIAGQESRLAEVELEVCADYRAMQEAKDALIHEQPKGWTTRVGHIERRLKTIAEEHTLSFLSRKAAIPKYGFPVDVVELDTRSGEARESARVALQRDLSQAIAEYAPGGKVVANKREWESVGVKMVPGKALHTPYYQYDEARNFVQKEESEPRPPGMRQYLIPQFGFVTALFQPPKEPRGRVRRLYTTRPFFKGFSVDDLPETTDLFGIAVSKALPGTLVVLCEGHNRQGFYICLACGSHLTEQVHEHRTPWDTPCSGTLRHFSLGHELVTDVVRIQVPHLDGEWAAYSVGYALLLGAAEALGVPATDLNVTIAGVDTSETVVSATASIVLYDNVPGGAGLVAQLEREDVFGSVLRHAEGRVIGACGCDSSCYGCLRSYRNQFAHPHLDRKVALKILSTSAQS